jgi:hypothetical protein
MAKSRPSVQKRKMEAKKLERRQIKATRRAEREQQAAERAEAIANGEDPDLIGIVPGPQPKGPEIDLEELMERL